MDGMDFNIIDEGERWIAAGCDPATADGLREFARHLTTRHSLTSGSHSAWRLMALYIDGPLSACLVRYKHLVNHHEYLEGFRLSHIGRRPPKWVVQWIDNEGLIPVEADYSTEFPMGTPLVEWQLRNAALWALNLRFAVTSVAEQAEASANQRLADFLPKLWFDEPTRDVVVERLRVGDTISDLFAPPSEALCFHSTVESVCWMIDDLDMLRPKFGTNYDDHGDERWRADKLLDKTTRPQRTTYCALCWRPTAKSSLVGPKTEPYSDLRRRPDLFCDVHKPRSAAYQADVRYRKLFKHELSAAKHMCSSAYDMYFTLPSSASEEERRKAIYDLVHALPTRPLYSAEPATSLLERVFVRERLGKRNVAIASDLGISKQAVGRALKKLDELRRVRANEMRVYPDTHEAFTLSDGRSSKLFADVRRLQNQGATTAQIAKQLHYFKHTIKAVYRWLDDPTMAF